MCSAAKDDQRIHRQKVKPQHFVSPDKDFGLTLDTSTQEIIQELARANGIGKRDVLRQIVSELACGKISSGDVLKFYHEVWSILVSDSDRMHVSRYSWHEDLDDALLRLSSQVHRIPNRSEMIRIIVAYVGVQSGLVKVRPVKAKRLELIKRETNFSHKPQRTGKPLIARSAA